MKLPNEKEIKEMREKTNLSFNEIARQLNMNIGKIIRLEKAQGVNYFDAKKIIEFYNK